GNILVQLFQRLEAGIDIIDGSAVDLIRDHQQRSLIDRHAWSNDGLSDFRRPQVRPFGYFRWGIIDIVYDPDGIIIHGDPVFIVASGNKSGSIRNLIEWDLGE